MVELEDRLRRLADDHARRARPPGAAAAVRRGRRRRRRQATAATVALAALAGVLVGVRGLGEEVAVEPAAPTATTRCAGPGCDRRPVTLPRGFEPVEGRVVAEGERPGYRWRLVVRREPLPGGRHRLVALYQHDDRSPPADLVTLEPVLLAYLLPSSDRPELDMAGIVTDRTALVRLELQRDGLQAPPIEVRPLDSAGLFPHNRLFVAVLPEGTVLHRIVLLDRRGRPICEQRLATLMAPGGAGSCF
jgi:hypothetical protein